MLVRDIMTPGPATAAPDALIGDVARLMVANNCGAIPICDPDSGSVVGIVTDRDITCRLVAKGIDPGGRRASECMTSPVVTVSPETTLDECCTAMEANRVRRAVVVDNAGRCVGMVAQADIALHAPIQETGGVVKEVSRQGASR